MVFNSDSDGQDIVSYIADATGLNTTADLQYITRMANAADREIWAVIFEAYGGWQFDDSNNSDLPTATADVVVSQSKYTLPTDAITVRQVSIKDESDFWHDLTPITLEDIHKVSTENEFQDTASTPRYYRLTANVIELYPATSYTQTRSLRVQFDRGMVGFASTATTATPGYASEFHDATWIGAAYMIATQRTLKNLVPLREQWAQKKADIAEYYKARFVELNPTEKVSHLVDPLNFVA